LQSSKLAKKLLWKFKSQNWCIFESRLELRFRGVSLLDVESMSKFTNDPEGTIISALNVWTLSVMNMPWFHADVHAVNLLVLEDGRVGFIDFGIVGRVNSETFNALSELSAALATGNYKGMALAPSLDVMADDRVQLGGNTKAPTSRQSNGQGPVVIDVKIA
jgi:hypothetical protein